MLNQKGGVGKTTSTVNIGAGLAEAGQRVLLLDLDPQGHLTLHLGIDGDAIERTVYDVLIDPECPITDALITAARPNLDAVFAEVDLAGAETELVSVPDRQGVLRRKLGPILDRYDVVLIDCPPSLGLLTLNALTVATEIFVPMQAHFLALQGVGRLLETVGLVCQSVNPALAVSGIILCMHERQTTLAREIVADLDAFFDAARDQPVPWRDCRVLKPPIRRNIKLAEAPSFGQTIFDYAPWCPGALDYRRLVEELLAAWYGRPVNPAPDTATPTAASASIEPKPKETEASAAVAPEPPIEPVIEVVDPPRADAEPAGDVAQTAARS